MRRCHCSGCPGPSARLQLGGWWGPCSNRWRPACALDFVPETRRFAGVGVAFSIQRRSMGAMTAALEDGADPDWEYAPLRIPADVSRLTAAAQLSLRAEFGDWELARVI